MMGKLQIIQTDGEDLVVITRSDDEALLARAGDEASEDAMTARIVEATDAKIARGEDVALPTAVWAAIENGEHPIRAIRKYRGLTQIDVAEQARLRRNVVRLPFDSGCADQSQDRRDGPGTDITASFAS